ncbi:hypothetical protein, partial [Clavibacter michiganensis]|uniref:hypothetical protein n=1 Tax=Clavibacter michiganensis TaxID=28447 RepID=UPI00292CB616
VSGWHPHLHVLLLFPVQVSPAVAEYLRALIYRWYSAGLGDHGFDADEEHGAVLAIATTRRDADVVLGRYLNKVALEIGRPDLKRARGDGGGGEGRRWTPMDLLDAATSDRPDLLWLWHEWQLGTKGIPRVTHGGTWNAMVEAAVPAEE